MSERIVILGCGGSSYDLLDIVEAINQASPTWQLLGFLDDTKQAGDHHLGFPVLGKLREAEQLANCRFINAIGSPASFLRKADILASTGMGLDRFATLCHPAAGVSHRAALGGGVVINYGVSLAGGVAVGNHVSIGPRCIVGHDSKIGDCTIVAPGAVISGFVEIGRSCYLGASCCIRERVRIGDGALIGMGAVVISDVEAGAVVVGNPAKPLQLRDQKASVGGKS